MPMASAGRRVTLYGQIAGMIGGDSACHEVVNGPQDRGCGGSASRETAGACAVVLAWYQHRGSGPRWVPAGKIAPFAAQRGTVMTVTTDGVAARRAGARGSGRGPARAAAPEQPSRADRVARGKDARAAAALESHAEFRPGRSRDPGGVLLGQGESRGPER